MNKKLFPFLFLLFPVFSFAQNQPPLLKDFDNSVLNIQSAKKISDHVSIMQVNVDNDNFDMIAVNDQMQILWKTRIKGYVIGFGIFKGKLITIAATNNSEIKGISNIYNGLIIDEQTGKIIQQKEIYHGSEQYQEIPTVYFDDAGSIFKLVVRQTAVERKMFTTSRTITNMQAVQDITIIDFNDQLEPLTTIKPVISNDVLIGITGNSDGDTFIAWLKDNRYINIIKYLYGKTEPISQLTQELDTRNLMEPKGIFINMLVVPSSADKNIIYFGGVRATIDNEMQLTVCKFNFNINVHKISTELFDKNRFKSIEKNFISPGQDLPAPNLGYPPDMILRFESENEGMFIIGVAAYSNYRSSNTFYQTENSLLICGYDSDLKPQYQQVMPSGYSVPGHPSPGTFHLDKGTLYAVYNYRDGLFKIEALYGNLDVKTGKWIKMEKLSKSSISNGDFADGAGIIWFGNCFIVPYLDVHGLIKSKCDITLQQNLY